MGADALPVRSIPAWAGEPVPVPMQPHAERVYPRVGGGTGSGSLQSKPGRGLSPRGRGNRRESLVNSRDCRSIPAWAGEPAAWSWNTRLSKVYPRVGGGTASVISCARPGGGLSPRGRGNHSYNGRDKDWLGSIPAWAGEPVSPSAAMPLEPVYPRVGGGTLPRGALVPHCTGLSPRGRGNRGGAHWKTQAIGSIPAWAGEPSVFPNRTAVKRVYPRVGGGTAQAESEGRSMKGLSPRGRGNRLSRGWSTMR